MRNFAQMKKKFWGYNPYKGFFLGSKSTVFGLGLSELEKLAHASYQTTAGLHMYIYNLSCNKIWLNPPLDGCQCGYTTKVKETLLVICIG